MGKIFAWMKGAPPCVFFHREGGVLLGFGVRGDSTGHNGSADLRCCLAGESSTKRRGSSKVIRYILKFSAQLFAFIRHRLTFQRLETEFDRKQHLVEAWKIIFWKIVKWSDLEFWMIWLRERYTIGTSYRVVQYLYVAKLICRLREMVMRIVINH